METDILSNKQYISGILNTKAPSGKGTIIEYTVLTTLGDCIKETFNFPYDLTSKKLGEINVKSSSRHDSKNGYEWAFGKRPDSYIPDYFVCVGLNKEYTEILHVWVIPGNARVIGSYGVHVIDSPRGLKRVAKYEVDPVPYNEVFQSIDFTSFPEFCNTGNTDLIKNRSLAGDLRDRKSIDELEMVYGIGCYQSFLDWIHNNKLKKYFDIKTGLIGIYQGERSLEMTEETYPTYDYMGKYMGFIKGGRLTRYDYFSLDDKDRPVPKIRLIRNAIRAYTETNKTITLDQIKQETGIEDPEPILNRLRQQGDIILVNHCAYKYV